MWVLVPCSYLAQSVPFGSLRKFLGQVWRISQIHDIYILWMSQHTHFSCLQIQNICQTYQMAHFTLYIHDTGVFIVGRQYKASHVSVCNTCIVCNTLIGFLHILQLRMLWVRYHGWRRTLQVLLRLLWDVLGKLFCSVAALTN